MRITIWYPSVKPSGNYNLKSLKLRNNLGLKDITELKKDVVRREQEKKQLEDVVEQDKLIPIKSRSLQFFILNLNADSFQTASP